MIVKLEDRNILVERARYLMNKYYFTAFESLKIAEQEYENQIKKGRSMRKKSENLSN